MQIVPGSTTDRELIARGLSKVLGDTHALCAKTRRFHRDITGSSFSILRLVLEQQRVALQRATGVIAKHMRARGLAVLGPKEGLRTQPQHQGRLWTAQEMIASLTERHESVARRARRVLGIADRAHDQPTCELLVQRIQAHERTAWLLLAIGTAELILRELQASQ